MSAASRCCGWTAPLNDAPSARTNSGARTRPRTDAVGPRSTRWVPIRVPAAVPNTLITRATMSPLTVAVCPTVTDRPSPHTGPSTRPSITRSSALSISPRMVMLDPTWATSHCDTTPRSQKFWSSLLRSPRRCRRWPRVGARSVRSGTPAPRRGSALRAGRWFRASAHPVDARVCDRLPPSSRSSIRAVQVVRPAVVAKGRAFGRIAPHIPVRGTCPPDKSRRDGRGMRGR